MLSTKTIIIAGAGMAAAAGLALAGASLAGAESVPTATSAGYGYGHTGGNRGEGGTSAANGNTDPSKPMRSDEQLLTGDVAAKVTAAALAKEPGATIERVETDSEGVYEAHLVRADGTHVIVQVGADFAVTNVQEHAGGPAGGPGGGKGRGAGGRPPAGGTEGGQAPSASGSATAG
ncbi:MAG: hypothetical protein ABJA89_13705 [Lapillicoccus sp.]